LKNINTLIKQSISLYCLDDETFPKNFNGDPSEKTLNGIKLVQQKLHILYSKKVKQQSGELFKRKIAEGGQLPEYVTVEKVMQTISTELPPLIDQLQEYFGSAGMVKVSSDKTSTPGQRHVNS